MCTCVVQVFEANKAALSLYKNKLGCDRAFALGLGQLLVTPRDAFELSVEHAYSPTQGFSSILQ
jgi:hypothetical protein